MGPFPNAERVLLRKNSGGSISDKLYFYAPGGALLSTETLMLTFSGLEWLAVSSSSNDAYLAGRRIGTQDSGGLVKRLSDIRDSDYQSADPLTRKYPFGEMDTYTEGDHFATYKRSAGTTLSLDYSRNRTYAPTLGRFTSPDPYEASGSVDLPGSWNRAAYVEGDPVNQVDPLGLSTSILGQGIFETCWETSGGAPRCFRWGPGVGTVDRSPGERIPISADDWVRLSTEVNREIGENLVRCRQEAATWREAQVTDPRYPYLESIYAADSTLSTRVLSTIAEIGGVCRVPEFIGLSLFYLLDSIQCAERPQHAPGVPVQQRSRKEAHP